MIEHLSLFAAQLRVEGKKLKGDGNFQTARAVAQIQIQKRAEFFVTVTYGVVMDIQLSGGGFKVPVLSGKRVQSNDQLLVLRIILQKSVHTGETELAGFFGFADHL